MFLDLGSFMFNVTTSSGGGTPSWGTSFGTARPDYKITAAEADRLLVSMAYKSIQNPAQRIECPFGKGGNDTAGFEFVLGSVYDKVFVNGAQIQDAKFALIVVKEVDPSKYHCGRRLLKYSPKIKVDGQEINHDCIEKIKNALGISDNGSWFVNEIDVRNQDELHLRAYILDKNSGKTFASPQERKDYIKNNCLAEKPLPYALNTILYGAPGTGKTYSTSEYAVSIIEKSPSLVGYDRPTLMKKYSTLLAAGQICFTTFHQNYGYEDFVQGLRPDVNSPTLKFDYVDGVFKTIADRAKSDPDNNYVMVIDEINRANISKVLGELITLLEKDKRSGEINEISVTLPSGDSFSVPKNLYIIGTMNTADKSISLLDVAIRRRFEFVQVPVRYDLLSGTSKIMLEKLNKKLYSKLEHNVDLLIGHAYFIGKTDDDIPNIFNNCIIPLLYEYFFDNSKDVKEVLVETIKDLPFSLEESEVSRIKIKKSGANA